MTYVLLVHDRPDYLTALGGPHQSLTSAVSELSRHPMEEEHSTIALETVALYYVAWQNKQGDLGDVPLAEDFAFTGPDPTVMSSVLPPCRPLRAGPPSRAHVRVRTRCVCFDQAC
jgi:hypothetical protein